MNSPLAERIRPKSLDEVCGQRHIIGENAPLSRLIKAGKLTNMIFYGPSGVGKTTVANIVAETCGMTFRKINATNAGGKDIKEVLTETGGIMGVGGILLYLDEIQYLNRKQQQTLLEYIEDGRITLIASTTENPAFYVYRAILSRSAVFEFKPISDEDVEKNLYRALSFLNAENNTEKTLDADAAHYIARLSGGDVRASLNSLEICFFASDDKITSDTAEKCAQNMLSAYDRAGDDHYELLSALQKSIRGSDENAAVFYLARLLSCGDIAGACRRLLVIASEDVGMAYPAAIQITKSCVDAALMLGMPEARIPLAEAAVLLATSPKSNTSYVAINEAMADVEKGLGKDMPPYLKNNHTFGEGEAKGEYIYPHGYPFDWVKQEYLPRDIRDKVYYRFGENKNEQSAKQYWEKIKK